MAAQDRSAPQEAHRRLVDLMNEAVAARKGTRAALATKAGISAGALSNALSGHAVPNFLTVQQIADALDVPEEEWREWSRLRDQADPRSHRAQTRDEARRRQLDGYVAAAHKAARLHPYPGFSPAVAPPLDKIYRPQRIVPLHPDALGRHAATESEGAGGGRPAVEEILAEERTCIVVAGPGGGKSSLFRTCLTEGLSRWSEGRTTEVPVLVPAPALTGRPFSEALAAAVTTRLHSHGLVGSIPAEFFADAPRSGTRWLVLVDGLDEVADPAGREHVLETLESLAKGQHAHLYRFVVTTRPLLTGTLDVLGAGVRRYELLPFSPENVQSLARNWFEHLELPDPEQMAERFARTLASTRITELARTPLMTAMLCQLHAEAPDEDVPGSRGQIYRKFTEHLHRRQYAVPPGAHRDHFAGLDRTYGANVLAHAERTLEQLPELLAHFATERRRNQHVTALKALESHPAAQRPTPVLPDEWRAFLEEALLRSGLLTLREGDFDFVHQTLLEYCAARNANQQERTQVLRFLVKRWWQRWKWPPDPRLVTWQWGGGPPRMVEEASYYSFLLDDGVRDASEVESELRALATRCGADGCAFLAVQHLLGTALPQSVPRAAADTLAKLSRLSHPARWAARAQQLLGIDGEASLGPDWILWRSAEVIAIDDRVNAALLLDLFDDGRSRAALNELARTPYADGVCGARAAFRLARSGDRGGVELLADLAQNPRLKGAERVRAAGFLAEHGDERGARLLMELARDPGTRRTLRAEAAAWLTDVERRAADAAARQSAARVTAAVGENGADLLVSFAGDTSWRGTHRLGAAELLKVLRDDRASGTYSELAGDPTLKPWHRRRARREVIRQTQQEPEQRESF
ncbi:NACHT domain-containing protein [Streptomyces sp. NBC_00045]|uniref:NACHT domain-containing protein n=1 Tax=Streptomyces sp. NBC_00045 TaxID=2975625 RepID=UPI0032490ACD